MKYYILEFDSEYDCIIDKNIPKVFSGISLNFGINYDNLPSIKLIIGEK